MIPIGLRRSTTLTQPLGQSVFGPYIYLHSYLAFHLLSVLLSSNRLELFQHIIHWVLILAKSFWRNYSLFQEYLFLLILSPPFWEIPDQMHTLWITSLTRSAQLAHEVIVPHLPPLPHLVTSYANTCTPFYLFLFPLIGAIPPSFKLFHHFRTLSF